MGYAFPSSNPAPSPLHSPSISRFCSQMAMTYGSISAQACWAGVDAGLAGRTASAGQGVRDLVRCRRPDSDSSSAPLSLSRDTVAQCSQRPAPVGKPKCLITGTVAQRVKNLPVIQETQVQTLGGEDPLEKRKATHSSILAWRIPWIEEPGGLQSMGSQRVGHN